MAAAQLARLRSAAAYQAAPRGRGVLTTANLLPAVAWLVAINGWTFVRFWQDKQRAAKGQWRVSESELLSLAFLGGSPAAFAARSLLRHKTRKQPFSTQLLLIAVVQATASGWLALVR